MSSEHLDLRLTDEEKKNIAMTMFIERPRLAEALAYSQDIVVLGNAIADAAVAKTAYAILEWLGEWGMHSFCGKHHFPPVEYANPKLFDILKAMGIENPAGDGEFHEAAGKAKPAVKASTSSQQQLPQREAK